MVDEEGAKVIIFGAGIVGEVMYNWCQEVGLLDIECFVDEAKCGGELFGKKIIHPKDMDARQRDSLIYITPPDIGDVIKKWGFKNWYGVEFLMGFEGVVGKVRAFEWDLYKYSAGLPYVGYCFSASTHSHRAYTNPGFYVRAVEVIITEKCTLRCADCSNLTQYYEDPKHLDTVDIIKDIDDFLALVDEVHEFRIIGAEALTHPEWHIIARHLRGQDKVHRVVIYTNGTIVPTAFQLESIIGFKPIFIITNYGTLSKNLTRLTEVLDAYHIDYHVQRAGGWSRCGEIKEQFLTPVGLKEHFLNCCVHNYTTLVDGRVYRCPFSAHAMRLKLLGGWVEHLEDYRDIAEGREVLKKYLQETKYLNACNYCNGRPFSAPQIPAGVQKC